MSAVSWGYAESVTDCLANGACAARIECGWVRAAGGISLVLDLCHTHQLLALLVTNSLSLKHSCTRGMRR